MTAAKKPAPRGTAKPARKRNVTEPKAAAPEAEKAVVEAGPVAVHVDAGEVSVVVAPPGRTGIDRRIFGLINGLPHSTTSDRYVSVMSDLGEGLGWVAGGAALAILGGPKGRRGWRGPLLQPPSRGPRPGLT